MKKIVLILTMSFLLLSFNNLTNSVINKIEIVSEKINIKIKNDTAAEVKVINTGSGGSYSLTKGATTTIKMDEGDKLHYYDKGKKAALLLIAAKDMDGKIQLLSRL